MKEYADTKFVSIGFGFLAGYLFPCYSRFCSKDAIGEHIIAVTADEATLPAKRTQYPFPILLNDNRGALDELHPDVILFSPPPAVAPTLAREVLKPYYDSLRKDGLPLPDLYAFPPSPQGAFYMALLGDDVNVCNILPNMTREIAGHDLHGAEGNSYVTIPEDACWPQENLARLQAVFEPLGGIVYVCPAQVRDMLATLCVAEMLPLVVFDIADGLTGEDAGLDSRKVAEAMRAAHQERWQYHPAGSTPCSDRAVSPALATMLRRFCEAWCQGPIDYLQSVGMDAASAEKIVVSNVDLRLHIAQLETRAAIDEVLRSHATKGGVAERARLCYELLCSARIRAAFSDLADLSSDDAFFAFCESASCEIAKIVALHGRRLANDAIAMKFTPEHHAILYALFVRNAKALAGEDGAAAAHAGTLLYADQRGARMAKRAIAHGDTLTPFSYMAYGEWAPEPGTMKAEDVAYMPEVITKAYVCPWHTAWERMGFLHEGAAYCSCIDYHLVKGFSKEMELNVVSTRTEGADCCEFVWKDFGMDEAARKALAEKKAQLQDSCRKDWVYHTRHIYAAMLETLGQLPDGAAIIEKTMTDFAVLYGDNARCTVAQIDGIDFYEV